MKISGKIIDLHERRIYPAILKIEEGRIESISEAEDAEGVYIIPGLVDSHVHIESSMVTPAEFAVTAVRHGTVGVVSDPHEIANIMGVEGIEYMISNAETVPVKFCFGAPSCVPATTFESSGAVIGPADIEKLLRKGEVKYLAEMMNFPGVINDAPDVTEKIKIAHDFGVVIDGHAPGLRGTGLKKYAAAGISTDHECSDLKEALEKVKYGIRILIREGSAAKNLEALAPLLKSNPEMVMLCSDDLHPEALLKGHINRLVARLISKGYDLFDVLRAATVNPVAHYGLKTGLLRAGDPADFIIIDNPSSMKVLQTWIDGKCVFDGQKTLFKTGNTVLINNFNCSPIKGSDIEIINKGHKMRVIVARNRELFTGSLIVQASGRPVEYARPDDDILKIVIKERYRNAAPGSAFIRGFGIKNGAFATSVAHDSHNIIAVGTSDKFIVEAINMIIDAKGGMAVVSDRENELLRLPVAGIMSDLTVSSIAGQYQKLSEKVKSLGCMMDAPFMTLSFMALLVIPELKLSDKGLFDGLAFNHVPLFI